MSAMAHSDDIPFGDALDERPRDPGAVCDVGVVFAELCDPEAPDAGHALGAFLTASREVTAAHGGYVDRGDDLCASLSVFEAPASRTSAADAALAAARDLRARLTEEVPGVAFGIGISVGASVAGWIQATRRFEPLVVRAPLSESRRLCRLARREAPAVLASERALARASSSEAGRWSAIVAGLRAATLSPR
jgi:adenylate cyclase